jgi:hypothetical protein
MEICSLVRRRPTDYGASLCVIYKPQEREGCGPQEKETANMFSRFFVEDIIGINLIKSASRWFLLRRFITMHGPYNVRCLDDFFQ